MKIYGVIFWQHKNVSSSGERYVGKKQNESEEKSDASKTISLKDSDQNMTLCEKISDKANAPDTSSRKE